MRVAAPLSDGKRYRGFDCTVSLTVLFMAMTLCAFDRIARFCDDWIIQRILARGLNLYRNGIKKLSEYST
jgi:hypothetical protein